MESLQWNQQEASDCDKMIRKRFQDAAAAAAAALPTASGLFWVITASWLRSTTNWSKLINL